MSDGHCKGGESSDDENDEKRRRIGGGVGWNHRSSLYIASPRRRLLGETLPLLGSYPDPDPNCFGAQVGIALVVNSPVQLELIMDA